MRAPQKKPVKDSWSEQNNCPESSLVGNTWVVHRPAREKPPTSHQPNVKRPTPSYDTTPPQHFSSSHPCIRQATIVSPSLHKSSPHLTHHFIARFQYRRHKAGFCTTSPGNHPQLPLPPVSNRLCDSLSHR